MTDKLQELKQEATDLGITYSPNIGEATLQKKIDEFYEAQDQAAKEALEAAVAQAEAEDDAADTDAEVPTKATNTGRKSVAARAKEKEIKARKTRIVTIIDNDHRVNNQTTTATVSCGNMYFNLGRRIIPLNTKVEVMQGHLKVLKNIRIPQHVKDPKNPSLSRMVLRPRYTIQYEDVE